MKFSVTDFFSKCDQICNKLWIWSQLLKTPVMENIFCGVMELGVHKHSKKTAQFF